MTHWASRRNLVDSTGISSFGRIDSVWWPPSDPLLPPQSVQLRTHSLFPPYIDQDLQNRYVCAQRPPCTQNLNDRDRWWDFGADAYVVRSLSRDFDEVALRRLEGTEHQQARPSHPSKTFTNGISHSTTPFKPSEKKLTGSGMAVVSTTLDRQQFRHRSGIQGELSFSFRSGLIDPRISKKPRSFQINGESLNLFGDGLAVWLSSTRAQPGPVFGSISATLRFFDWRIYF